MSCLLALSTVGKTQPVFSTWGTTYASVSGSAGFVDDPQSGGSSSITQSQTFVSSSASSGNSFAQSSFYGESSSGVLKASATSLVSLDLGDPFSNGSAFAHNKDNGVNPGGRVKFNERIFISGAPVGTTVQFQLVGLLTASIDMNNGMASGQFRVRLPGEGVQMELLALNQGANSVTQTATVSLVSGNWTTIEADLMVQSYTTASSNTGLFNAHAYIDAANSAYTYLRPVTVGATAVGETGHIYSNPVPEPATMSTLALGLAAMMRRRKRVV